ncbi:MAG: heavy-metal-associated domain-containing protein [Candidatus Goldbacteria bacterium]|nr:heavy-metal-associated domain-containing protein [Candidatus Goldiibacteriota bacterium]
MKQKIMVSGMHCPGCEMNVKMALEEKDGIKKVKVDYKKGTVELEFDEKKISIDGIKKTIRDAGYGTD